MKGKKILIVVIIIIIALLAIGGGAFAYLYVATDTFKSDKELFAKYISQNTEIFQKLKDSQTVQIYRSLNNEKKYESNTEIKAVYSEGGEVSNPINNLAAKLDIQKDADDQYFYMDGQILFNQEEYLETEIINDKELYGIRFSDVAKQFISIKDDTNLESVANNIGTDTATLQKIIDIMNGENTITNEIITQDEIQSLKEKYTNMLVEAVSNGTFSSNKKAMITYNNNTIKAKSYTVSLSNTQIEDLIIQVLNSLKNETVLTKEIDNQTYIDKIDEEIKTLSEEEEVPSVKITVYEQGRKAIRTIAEIGEYKIVVENSDSNEQVKSNIQINKVTAEQTEGYNVVLTKENKENKEDINLEIEAINGEQNYTLSFSTETSLSDNNIGLNATIGYKKDILTAAIEFNNTVKLNDDFDKKVKLENTNNVTLNDMQEERRINIIETLKNNVPLKIQKRLELLQQALEIENDRTDKDIADYELSQVEINKFNAKFEFYTGDEVSAENVKSLLNIVGENLGSYDIKLADNQEDISQLDEDKIKYVIKLNIERNKSDKNGINKVLEKISDNKKYKVSISYKGENQLIDYIMIEEAAE